MEDERRQALGMVDDSRPRESVTSPTGELQHSVEHPEYGDKYVGFDEGQHDGFTPFLCLPPFLIHLQYEVWMMSA
jgi:hypothetical protein